MRRIILVAAAAIALISGACSSSAASNDPYEIVHKATEASWQQVQVDLGVTVKSGATTVTLDPGSIRVVADTVAGKGLFHLSLPAALLGSDASSLAQLGVTGTTIDFDALYDGQALYAKSPILGAVIAQLMAGASGAPSGDMGGWLRLATKADLESFAAGNVPEPSPSASFDATTIKKDLNDNGLTLTFVGTEKRNGADEDHVSIAVDVNKLLASSAFDSMNQGQVKQLRDAAQNATVSADVWTDHASGRFAEFDIHIASTGTTAGSADISITLATPAAGTSFDAPANAVDVPAKTLIGQALQVFGQSLGQ